MASIPRLPDLLTTANLCCGVLSVILASQGELTSACWLVFAGAFFDVLDGFAARALGGGTPLGAQLDSMADMVTFGMAPGMIAALQPYNALLVQVGNAERNAFDLFSEPLWMAIACAMVIAIASAWRLAKFNNDDRETTGFFGLATPANALLWASLGLISVGMGIVHGPMASGPELLITELTASAPAKLVLAIALGILMLSDFSLPGLKFKHYRWAGNEVIYILLVLGALLAVLYGILAVPFIMLVYLASPVWGRVFGKPAL